VVCTHVAMANSNSAATSMRLDILAGDGNSNQMN